MQEVDNKNSKEMIKIAERIDPDYLMCMLCKNSAHYTNGKIECEYEDEDGELKPKLLKNFECGEFNFYAPNLVEVLVRIIKEIRGK